MMSSEQLVDDNLDASFDLVESKRQIAEFAVALADNVVAVVDIASF